jgi:hypothetical protein
MSMTQQAIKDSYQDYKDSIAFHNGEVEVLRARIGVLQAQCKHPDKYTYSAMGELGVRCPDCGYQT